MKTQIVSIITCCILFVNISFAQNKTECEKIVATTFEAINNKNIDKLTKHLSEDFTIANQKGEIAKIVLSQLITQLNDEVLQYEIVNETQTEVLTLIYNVTYAKMGKRNATFIFSKNNLLQELDILQLEIKILKNEDLQITFPDQPYIVIPFKRAGNLIAVDVELDNVKRTFLVDNGAPKLILNSHYIENQDENTKLSNAQGVSGSISGVDIAKIGKFDFHGITIENQDVLSMNISHLEKSLNTEGIYGLIGFEIYKDYDILFDYDKEIITLIKPEYTNIFIDSNYHNHTYYETPIIMSEHIPTIQAKIGNKYLKMGIDCGAESNLIHEKYYKLLKKYVKKEEEAQLVGAENEEKTVYLGKTDKILIGEKQFQKVPTVFNNIDHLNSGYKINIDGLIGYEILSKQKTLLSYKNEKLIFIE